MRTAEALPRSSVMMPAYETEATLRQSVASALAQTVEELEVIVVDDGSTVPAVRAALDGD